MRLSLAGASCLAVIMAIGGCGAVTRHDPPPASPAPDPAQHALKRAGLTVELAAKTRVPRAKSQAKPIGSARVSISPGDDRLCWTIDARTSSPRYAYIQRGLKGSAGPVVIALGSHYAPTGCVHGTAPALLRAIETRPANYYLSIHTQAAPMGAARGQL